MVRHLLLPAYVILALLQYTVLCTLMDDNG